MGDLETNTKFCYTCLKLHTEGTRYMRLDFSIPGDIPYTKKLKFCIPEMMLENIENSVLCKQCSIALDSAYLFRAMCLETENKLQLVRQSKRRSIESTLHNQDIYLDFGVVDVRTLSETEENGELTSIPNVETTEAVATTNSSRNCKDSLADQELLTKCCATLPELKNLTPQSLQCWVVSKKIIPIRSRYFRKVRNSTLAKNSIWCCICDRYISGKGHYNFHLRKHLNLAYMCTVCSVDCKNQKNYSLHKTSCTKKIEIVKEISPKKPPVKKNERKDRKFKNNPKILKVKFNVNVRKVIQRGIYNCKMCTYKTNIKSLLERHNRSHVGNPPFNCKYCPKIFLDSNKFIRHVTETKHTKPGKKISKVRIPIKKPIKKPIIKQATGRGIGPPPFECTTCSKVFHITHKFLRHIREAKHTRRFALKKVQVEVKKEKHICDVCEMDFISEFELADHRERLHLNNIENGNLNNDVQNDQITTMEPSNEYYCNICTTKFKKLEFFFNHNCIIDSPEPTYNCHLCNMSFLGRISLIEHMEVHFTIASQT